MTVIYFECCCGHVTRFVKRQACSRCKGCGELYVGYLCDKIDAKCSSEQLPVRVSWPTLNMNMYWKLVE